MQSGYIAEKWLGYTQITTVTTSTGIGTVPVGTSLVLIVPETQAVRWLMGGGDPTATVGQPLAVGAELRATAQQLSTLKFIEQAVGAKLNLTFFG